MKKTLVSLSLGVAWFVLPHAGQAACNPADIVIDGEYQDWSDCEVLISDSKGDISHMQYWNPDTDEWTTTDPGVDTYTFDDSAMVDISKVKMTNDKSYLYLYMESVWPMMNIQDPSGEYWDMMNMFTGGAAELLSTFGEVPTEMPSFDHWMVWSFDTNLDGSYDYFFGAHLLDSIMGEGTSGGPGLVVLEDTNGNGVFDEDTDQVVAEMSAQDGQTSMDEGANPGSKRFEVKQSITAFYEATGIQYGDTVKVRMETHSDAGDVTAGKRFTFDLGAPRNLMVKQITASGAQLSWSKNAAAHHFYVEVKQGDTVVATYTTKKNNLTISGLTANTQYRYHVRAELKKNFDGTWSKYKSFTTAE